jgi:hypothetical protein
MKSVAYVLFFIPLFSSCQFQNGENQDVNQKIFEKWKSAIVDLECRKELGENLDSQAMYKTLREYQRILYQHTGTSIFIEFDSNRYLITNRHVLFDSDAVIQKKKFHGSYPVDDDYSIFSKIFRVPSESDTSDPSLPDMPLTIMGAVPYSKCNYVYSSPELDLAIISFDASPMYKIFADLLVRRGYRPIHISDIDTSELHYGQDLFCVGFANVAFAGRINWDTIKKPWNSNLIYDPVFTFGKVAAPSIRKYFFLSDLTIAPGNSGGPVISNNKLVGIISSQAILQVIHKNGDFYPDIYNRYPYAYAIKSSYIFPLLKEMIEKDQRNWPKTISKF